VKAAGFEVERLFTTFIEEFAGHLPLLKFLEANWYDPSNRGVLRKSVPNCLSIDIADVFHNISCFQSSLAARAYGFILH